MKQCLTCDVRHALSDMTELARLAMQRANRYSQPDKCFDIKGELRLVEDVLKQSRSEQGADAAKGDEQ